jgi:hypothetical protein
LPLLNELGKWIVETYNTDYILFCAK